MKNDQLEILYNLKAEKALLSLIILQPDLMKSIIEKIFPEVFYHKDHRLIFIEMVKIFKSNNIIENVLLTQSLKEKEYLFSDKIEKVLESLLSEKFSIINKDTYIKILLDKYNKRMLIEVADDIYKNVVKHNNDYSYSTLVNVVDSKLSKIYEKKNYKYFQINDIVTNFEITKKNNVNKNITTGFKSLDDLTGGWHNEEFTIIASRPSVGKTTFALNLILHLLINNMSVLFFSIEMSNKQILIKLISLLSGLSYSEVRDYYYNNIEKDLASKALEKIRKFSLFICDIASIDIDTIEEYCKDFKRKNNITLDFIFIDYLQLIKWKSQDVESFHLHIGNICRILRSISRFLNIPVIVLSQLNRSADMSNDISFSQLKSSGSIEESADNIFILKKKIEKNDYSRDFNSFKNVFTINNNNKYNQYGSNNIIGNKINKPIYRKILLSVLKQRNGPIGNIYFNFNSEISKFVEDIKS